MRLRIWLSSASLVLLSAACLPEPSAIDQLGAPTHPIETRSGSDRLGADQVFDSGPILARGQIFRHEFTLANPSDRPLRLLRGSSSTPCCSAVDSMPRSIAPHSTGRIGVFLKAGRESGLRVVRFAIETDSVERAIRTMTLRARLYSEWESVRTKDIPASLTIGEPGKEVWRVVCRRKGTEGLEPPDTIQVADPVHARFLGPVVERTESDGVIEATREVEVFLPKSSELGNHRAEMVFHWANGRQEKQLIHWEIRPLVHLEPASLVLEPANEAIERTITITSDDRPIRVTGVRGDMLIRFSDVPQFPAKRLQISIRLAPPRGDVGGVSTIAITTDHPLQGVLSLRILFLPPKAGSRGAS